MVRRLLAGTRLPYAWLALATFLLSPPSAEAESARPFIIDDMFQIDRVADVELSPRGDRAVVVTQRRFPETYFGSVTSLWIVSTSGGDPVRIAANENLQQSAWGSGQSSPAWSFDGRWLAYPEQGNPAEADAERFFETERTVLKLMSSVVLDNGSMPLIVLERQVEDFIVRQSNGTQDVP